MSAEVTQKTEEKANGAQKVPEVAAIVKAGDKPSADSKAIVPAKGKAGTYRESRDVPLSEIIITPEFNIDPKRMTDEPSIRRLAQSIEATEGLLQNILLGAIQENGKTKLYLISGFRRYAAYKLLGKKSIPSTIRLFDSYGALIANGAENTGREAPHPYALAKRLAFIKEAHHKGDKDADAKLAVAFSITKKHVQNLLRMHRNLSPKLRKIFEGPSASLAEESVTLKWLIEHSGESHEDQDAAFDLRYGEGSGGDEDEKPKKKKKAKEDEDKAKKPRMRNRDEIIWAKDKTFRAPTEAQIKAGNDLLFALRKFNEPKMKKVSDRDRAIVRAVLGWVLDANAADFFTVIEPEEPEAEDEE